jgi:hypothetical protein
MRTWLYWGLSGLGLCILLAINGRYGEFPTLTVVTLIGSGAWVGAGVLLSARAVVRFLRR